MSKTYLVSGSSELPGSLGAYDLQSLVAEGSRATLSNWDNIELANDIDIYSKYSLGEPPHSESKGNTKANRRQKQRRSKSKAKAKQKQRKNEAKANQKQSKGKAKAKLTAILRHHADEGCAGDFAERRQIPELYCNIVCALPQPRFLGAGRS